MIIDIKKIIGCEKSYTFAFIENKEKQMFYQRTIKNRITCKGIGLHSGKSIHLCLIPSPTNTGIIFYRVDVNKKLEIPALYENVVNTQLATTIGINGITISTIEHLMAAITGLGIDNLRVEVDGPELPVMDGSALPFAYLLRNAEIVQQSKFKKFFFVKKPVSFIENDKESHLIPSQQFKVSCTIDFNHPLISNQSYTFDFSDTAFIREIARARTFGFMKDVEAMKRRGLALGGSLENAVVIDEYNVLNSDGLRYPDEFVRHKILDAIGDLALLGMPVIAHYSGIKSGHALNHQLVKKLISHPSSYEILHPKEKDQFEELKLRIPSYGTLETLSV